jgi:hypothetical protein
MIAYEDVFNPTKKGSRRARSGRDEEDMHLEDSNRGGVGAAIVVVVAAATATLLNPSKKLS